MEFPAPDTGSIQQPQQRRKRTAYFLLAVSIAAMLALTALYFYRNHYRLTFQNGTAWHNVPQSQSYPRGTQVTVTIQNPLRRDWARAEVIIESWTDDTGRDLLIRQIPAGGFNMGYCYQIGFSTEGHGFSGPSLARVAPPPGDPDPRKLNVQICTPVECADIATSMRVAGSVVLTEGHGSRRMTVPNWPVQVGATLTVGSDVYTVESIDRESGNRLNVNLKATGCANPIKALRLLDKAGHAIPAGEFDHWGMTEHLIREPLADDPETHYLTVVVPSSASTANLQIDYFSSCRQVQRPFVATVPVTHQTSGPGAIPCPLQLPVPAAAWGPLAPDSPKDLFDIRHVSSYWNAGAFRGFDTEFALCGKRPLTITSYNMTLTGCSDSDGHRLLGSPALRSCRSEWWGLWPDYFARSDNPGQFTFCISSSRMPAPTAAKITFQGQMTLQVGEEPKTVELKNISLKGTSHALGPVQLRLSREMPDRLEFFTSGNLGLLREISILSSSGDVLAHREMNVPNLYRSQEDVLYLDWPSKAPLTGLTVRATYLTRTRHYILPFTTTIPAWVQKSAPATTQPR